MTMADNKDKKVLNVPALRFPEFTDEWKEVLFASNLERLENGATYNTNDKDGVPMSRIETISTGRIDYTKVGHCSTPQKIEHYIMRYGDILFSHINSLKHIGKTAYYSAEEPLYHGMNLLLFRCKNNVDSKFFFFLINNTHFIRKCQILAKQAVNQASISTSDLKKIKVYIPDINEQSKIQKFLSLIEKRIELQNKIIEKYESLIQAICDTLIEQETQQVTLSFSDFGQSYSGLSGKSADDFGEGYPFITYMNVYQNQIIDLTDVGLVKINETEQQSVVRYGDILLTLSSETPEEVGMGAVYLGETYPLYLNSFCFGIHITDESKIYPPFLAYYVSSQSFRKAVYPLAQGSTRFNLQKSDFMKKKFSFPVIEKQHKIYSILKIYSDKLIVEKLIMRLLCNQKCYLLRQLFI
ncbi:restriction endonuclease subunit S [uncultured Alistipes sp.]|uniref:restriction endonuclease subunit S n=1 Tax=uncultured Alistipes sp. TaxID=538949 RepID=UPI003209FE62